MEKLSRRQKEVLSLYYVDELTLKEIGTALGVTESRICQIHGESMKRLRRSVQRMLEPPIPMAKAA